MLVRTYQRKRRGVPSGSDDSFADSASQDSQTFFSSQSQDFQANGLTSSQNSDWSLVGSDDPEAMLHRPGSSHRNANPPGGLFSPDSEPLHHACSEPDAICGFLSQPTRSSLPPPGPSRTRAENNRAEPRRRSAASWRSHVDGGDGSSFLNHVRMKKGGKRTQSQGRKQGRGVKTKGESQEAEVEPLERRRCGNGRREHESQHESDAEEEELRELAALFKSPVHRNTFSTQKQSTAFMPPAGMAATAAIAAATAAAAAAAATATAAAATAAAVPATSPFASRETLMESQELYSQDSYSQEAGYQEDRFQGPRSTTLMEAQESGEMMASLDEAMFALDGLKLRQPIRVQRSAATSLASICSAVDRRRLLRSQGLVKQIMNALLLLPLADRPLALAAAAIFFFIASDDAESDFPDPSHALSFLLALLKHHSAPPSPHAASDNPSTASATRSLPVSTQAILSRRDCPLKGAEGREAEAAAAAELKVGEKGCGAACAAGAAAGVGGASDVTVVALVLATLKRICASVIALQAGLPDDSSLPFSAGAGRSQLMRFGLKDEMRRLGGLHLVAALAGSHMVQLAKYTHEPYADRLEGTGAGRSRSGLKVLSEENPSGHKRRPLQQRKQAATSTDGAAVDGMAQAQPAVEPAALMWRRAVLGCWSM
ncbi:hypothetical protein CLOM_g6491 [Closterium sp. NIES-68]|nr:hypothetical protein CLOM_g6491 [Closterium sp. NIES-68]